MSPHTISPTRFHNSVHNAAAGYWTIGAGCMQATTALSAYDATFAEGLLEALAQLADGRRRYCWSVTTTPRSARCVR